MTSRLDGLQFSEGEKGAHLYDSQQALETLYEVDLAEATLDGARKQQALSTAALNRVKTDEIRRERIPLEIVTALWQAALMTFAATLKASSSLPKAKINELLGELEKVELPAKW